MLQRVVSLAAIVLALPVLLALSPIALVVLAAGDVATGRRDMPLPRLYLFGIVFVIHEWIGQLWALPIWLRTLAGRPTLSAYRRVQGWWADSLLRWTQRLLRLRIELPDPATLPSDDIIVLSRHASMIDAIVPAWIFAKLLDRQVHYVLKRELRWIPNIALYGQRLRNHFVARGGNTEAEVAAIESMAAAAEPGSGLVIFPEGTYATDASRARVMASLQRRSDQAAIANAASLVALLPAKPAGTLAMLRNRPDASVVVLGHVGLEGVAELSGLREFLPARHPVVINWWIHPRHELPSDDEALAEWLRARWNELDDWVVATKASRLG